MNIEVKISKNPITYKKAMLFMNKRVEEVKLGKNNELIWLLEHPTTYSAGVSFNKKDILNKNIKEVEDKLQDAIVEATKNHTKALEKKKEVEGLLEENYALLKQARQELEEIVDKQSAEYAEAVGKVTSLEQKVEELEGLKNAYTTLAASKDSFVHKHNLTIKVLTSDELNERRA